ncbi:MAG: hypothetical protein WDO24_11325 [Pseudomonadota bacterium]
MLKGGIIVAFDGREHRTLEDGVLVFQGDRIIHVGPSHAGLVDDRPVDRVIDTRGKLVIPGQISCHAHVSANEGHRPLVDGGRRDFMRSGFLSYIPSKGLGGRSMTAEADLVASIRYGIASLIRHGVTTAVAFNGEGGPDQAIVRLARRDGDPALFPRRRCAAAAIISTATAAVRDWDEAGGLAGLERAGAAIERFDGSHDGRVRGIVIVDEYYLSTPTLRRRAKALADRLGGRLDDAFLRAAFRVLRERARHRQDSGRAARRGGRARAPASSSPTSIYLSGSSYTGHNYSDDVGLIGRAGAAVAHSPLVFARRGTAMESFQRYLDAGITMAMGHRRLSDGPDRGDAHRDHGGQDRRQEPRVGLGRVGVRGLQPRRRQGAAARRYRAVERRRQGRHRDPRFRQSADWSDRRSDPQPDPLRQFEHDRGPSSSTRRTLMADGKLLVCDERTVLADAKASCDAVVELVRPIPFRRPKPGAGFPARPEALGRPTERDQRKSEIKDRHARARGHPELQSPTSRV